MASSLAADDYRRLQEVLYVNYHQLKQVACIRAMPDTIGRLTDGPPATHIASPARYGGNPTLNILRNQRFLIATSYVQFSKCETVPPLDGVPLHKYIIA